MNCQMKLRLMNIPKGIDIWQNYFKDLNQSIAVSLRKLVRSQYKYKLFVLTLLFIILAGVSAGAAVVPALTGRVVDEANILTPTDKARITDAIKTLEQNTGGQMAVLIMKTLDGDSLEGFATAVEDEWKIGHKGKDDGLVLIIIKNDRKIRIETGYGWEQYVTDARAGDIIRSMAPYFRKGKFTQGIIMAVKQVDAFVTGKPLPENKICEDSDLESSGNKSNAGSDFGFIILLIIFFIIKIFLWHNKSGTYGSGGGRGGFFGGFGGGGFGGGGGCSGGGGASGSW